MDTGPYTPLLCFKVQKGACQEPLHNCMLCDNVISTNMAYVYQSLNKIEYHPDGSYYCGIGYPLLYTPLNTALFHSCFKYKYGIGERLGDKLCIVICNGCFWQMIAHISNDIIRQKTFVKEQLPSFEGKDDTRLITYILVKPPSRTKAAIKK